MVNGGSIAVIVIGIGLLVLLLFIRRKIKYRKLLRSVSPRGRGTASERALVLALLKLKIPAETIFHDLYVNTGPKRYSQIDVVVATKVGIIVFEVKDYKGWIYGTGYKPRWTQVLNYGNTKHRFYNPIMQNRIHIGSLKRQLRQFDKIPFYSVVIFYGECELKDITFVPEGTFLVKADRLREVMKIILKKNEPAPYSNKRDVVNVLQRAVENGANSDVLARHDEYMHYMRGTGRIFD